MTRPYYDLESDSRFSGIGVRAYSDGIGIGGWYDSFVGIDGDLFLTWEQIEELRKKAKRRVPHGDLK